MGCKTWGVLCVLALGSGVIGLAQPKPVLKAEIPFDFMVGTNLLPAGKYTIEAGPGASSIVLQSSDHRIARFANTVLVQAGRRDDKSRLVFNRHGGEYFLSQIWSGNGRAGDRIPISKRERELTAKQASPAAEAIVTASAQ